MIAKFNQSNLDGCLIQEDVDPHDIMFLFDELPKETRDRVNNSPYKLCVACVSDLGVDEVEARIAEKLRTEA